MWQKFTYFSKEHTVWISRLFDATSQKKRAIFCANGIRVEWCRIVCDVNGFETNEETRGKKEEIKQKL
jgi:predicted sulfurtransferase